MPLSSRKQVTKNSRSVFLNPFIVPIIEPTVEPTKAPSKGTKQVIIKGVAEPTKKPVSAKATVPKTGDSTDIILWIVLQKN